MKSLLEHLADAESARERGAHAEGLAAAEAAWALAAGGEEAAPKLRAGLLLAHFRYRTGGLAASVTVAHAVLPLLRAAQHGPEDQRALIDLLRMATLSAIDSGRFEAALGFAQEALNTAQQLGEPGRISMATNALGALFERTGDPWQSERLMLDALALARTLPEPHPKFIALNNLAAVLISKYYLLRDAQPGSQAQDALNAALPHAEEATAMARASNEAFHLVFALGNLGEVLVNLGRADEAEGALNEARALALNQGFITSPWRIDVSLADLHLLRGQPQAAWDLLERLRAEMDASEPGDQRVTRMRLHHGLWRAAVALERTADALTHLHAYMLLERQRVVSQLQAQSSLFVTKLEAEQARHEARRATDRARALEDVVRRDPLTGLANRRALDERWPVLVAEAEAEAAHTPLTVAMLDLDHFKQVNDRFGHLIGDQVLMAVAALLRKHTRASDLPVRLGGEEFMLVLVETDLARAHEVCARLLQQVAQHRWGELSPGLSVTLSIGLATAVAAAPAATVMARADAALYRAKAAGRNQLVVDEQ
jgi:diguanylate cyclase (GGDEF)-like protein